MIYVGEHERSSRIRPESIDLAANQEPIQAMVQAALHHGSPLSYWELSAARPDLREDFVSQHRDILYLEERALFSEEEFEEERLNRTIGAAVDLRMKPEDTPLRGTAYSIEQLGLQSFFCLGSEVPSGTVLGTVMLRDDGPNPDILDDVQRTYLDIDLHSIGSVIVRGHVNTRRSPNTRFWEELHFDELTPLFPHIRHEIIFEPLGTRQVTALASYVLDRMPE